MAEIPWIEWLTHSNFSFLTGASHPEDLVQAAANHGYGGIALADYDGVYGLVKAFRRQQQLPDSQSLQLFYGSELHLAADHDKPVVYRDSITLLALNSRGYTQLNRILSLAHRNSKKKALLPLPELLAAASSDLVCLQPMRGLIRHQELDIVMQRYALLKEAFGSNLFLLISRHLNPAEDHWIPRTLQLSKQLDIPYLFSQDAFFHEEKSKEICDVLQAIRLNKTLDTVIPQLFVNHERCLRSRMVLKQRYQALPGFTETLVRSQNLAQRFNFCLTQLRYHYPQELLPPGHSSQSYLEKICWEAAAQIFQAAIPPATESLLRKELALVSSLGFSDYFITVWDIVRWARSQNILCQGRGSAANSSVCFVLGITAINPNCFDMLFERFISVERGDPPDIDVDFEHERREEVIQYIYQRYGRNRAAMVANIISFRRRGAMRLVGKALGIPIDRIEENSRLHKHERGPLSSPLESSKKATQRSSKTHEYEDLWHDLAKRIEGFPQHMGIHSAGFVLNHEDIQNVCPIEPATMEGRTVIQWAKDDIEYLNIFKIDILALGMLSVLRKAFTLIEHTTNETLSLDSIPADDQPTYAMIQRADTVGTFQIESRAQMSMLPRLRPRCFYDLVIQIGIIRPGPIQGGLIHPYLRRRQGIEKIEYPDPRLEPILKRTLGVPIFQEQVMRIAIAVGDFSPGESDQLRKQIGAWSLNKDLAPLIKKLEAGMRRNGLGERYIQQILGHLQGFASYGFPESHAISFALLAYASCYIKKHHPAAFYTALLNSQPVGFYSIHALLQAARREQLLVLPIDINRSNWDSGLEFIESRIWAIRLGLHLVRGLSENGAKRLLDIRQERGPWTTAAEFFQSSLQHRGDLSSLAAANALQAFGLERGNAIWLAEAVPFAPILDDEYPYDFGAESEIQRLERDFDAFASTLGKHPSQIIRESHWNYSLAVQDLLKASELEQQMDRSIVHVFGLILVRQAPMTAKGMEFFSLEDETGFINLVFTPQILVDYQDITLRQGFLCVTGRLQKIQDGHSILVQKCHAWQLKDPRIVPLPKTVSPTRESSFQLVNKLPPARNFR